MRRMISVGLGLLAIALLVSGYLLLPRLSLTSSASPTSPSQVLLVDTTEIEITYPESIAYVYKPLLTASKIVGAGERLGYYVTHGHPEASEMLRSIGLSKKFHARLPVISGQYANEYQALIGRAERELESQYANAQRISTSSEYLTRENRELVEADLLGAEDAATALMQKLAQLAPGEEQKRVELIEQLQQKQDAILAFKERLAMQPANNSTAKQSHGQLNDGLAADFLALSAKLSPDTILLLAPSRGKFVPSAESGIVGNITQLDTINSIEAIANTLDGYLLHPKGTPALLATANRSDSSALSQSGAIQVSIEKSLVK